MKQHFIFGIILLALMILIPLVSLIPAENRPFKETEATETTEPTHTESAQPDVPEKTDPDATIDVMRTANETIETVELREYLIGCVAAEMGADCHLEALKAQAVASHTFARYRLEVGKQESLSDSGASDQAYESAEQRKKRWGENYERNEAKIGQAVDAVMGQSITYEGKPIFAAYYAVSAGKTESAKNYWGKDYPYLRSVDSPGDKLSPQLSKTETFSADQIKKALKKAEGVKLGKDPAAWFESPKRSEAGTVLEIKVGGTVLTGRKIRELLQLRSANFTLKYKNESFTITCLGYGHGVGMSQNGADFMARQGSGYREILEHYYPGCAIA